MRIYINKLKPGACVRLRFNNDPENEAIALFVNTTGEGEDRRATFVQVDDGDISRSYEWDAYRYAGRWAYGSSAQPLRVIEVIA